MNFLGAQFNPSHHLSSLFDRLRLNNYVSAFSEVGDWNYYQRFHFPRSVSILKGEKWGGHFKVNGS